MKNTYKLAIVSITVMFAIHVLYLFLRDAVHIIMITDHQRQTYLTAVGGFLMMIMTLIVTKADWVWVGIADIAYLLALIMIFLNP